MAEDPTSLTLEQRERVRKFLDQWKAPHCPFCGSDKWFVGEHMVTPMTTNRLGQVMVDGFIYPQIMVISEPCGHTVFFNAIAVGVLPGRISEAVTSPLPPLAEAKKDG